MWHIHQHVRTIRNFRSLTESVCRSRFTVANCTRLYIAWLNFDSGSIRVHNKAIYVGAEMRELSNISSWRSMKSTRHSSFAVKSSQCTRWASCTYLSYFVETSNAWTCRCCHNRWNHMLYVLHFFTTYQCFLANDFWRRQSTAELIASLRVCWPL